MEMIAGGTQGAGCAVAVGIFALASAFAIVTEGIGAPVAAEAAGAALECLNDD